MGRRTIRVLSLDGGGTRGFMSNYFLQKFIQLWGIDPLEIWKYFDVICGTSVGGLNALAYAYGKTPTEIENFYIQDAKWVFTIRNALDFATGSNNASTPSNRPNTPQKVAILAQNDQFYKSVSDTSNYGSALLYNRIRTLFGTATMQDLKTNTVVPSYRYDNKTTVMFSNANYAEYRGQNELISNVALSTAAPNIYLPSIILNNGQYVDGGIFQNNPSYAGLTLGKMLKQRADRFLVLSLGTGLGSYGFENQAPGNIGGITPSTDNALVQMYELFSVAMVGNQEAISFNMQLESNYTLDNLYTYRFQPNFDPNEDTELDNSTPEFFQYLRDVTDVHFNENIQDISTFLARLDA
jgi:patatin-like phospholipase/acyl hydrolase